MDSPSIKVLKTTLILLLFNLKFSLSRTKINSNMLVQQEDLLISWVIHFAKEGFLTSQNMIKDNTINIQKFSGFWSLYGYQIQGIY